MTRLLRPHVLAWLVTGLLAFLVFAAGPLVLVALTNLMLLSRADTQAAFWILSLTVGALKASAIAAILLTGLHLVRRGPPSRAPR